MKAYIHPLQLHILLKWLIACCILPLVSFVQAQQENIECNLKNPWIPETFVVDLVHNDTLKSFWQNGGHVPENLINADPNDFARAHIKQSGWAKVRIYDTDTQVIYQASNYVGFLVKSKAFKNGQFSSVTIRTYLNGEMRESYTGQDLVSYSPQFLSDPVEMGFITSMTYNQLELVIDTALGMESYDVYFAQMESFCEAELSECNVMTPMSNPAYPLTVNFNLTGSSDPHAGYINNHLGAISESTSDYASLVCLPNAAVRTFITLQNQAGEFEEGTFLGFDISNTALISSDLLENLSVSTFLNGTMQDSISGAGLLIGSSVGPGNGRQTIGIITRSNVDEVRLVVHQTIGLNLGTTRVFSAVILRPCEGELLGCNVSTTLDNPAHPVMINGANTGISGALCLLCDVRNAGNVIDEDTTNYASIIVTAGVNAVGNLSVLNVLENYPAGTFAGYYIENTALAEGSVFSNLTITTYLDGIEQESETGSDALINVDSDLLLSPDQKLVGMVTTMPFDEVKISLYNTLTVDVGTTRVYSVVIDSLCEGTIACDSTFWMFRPDFPAVIDAELTGIDGVLCIGCEVDNTAAVLSEDQEDFATIDITAGALSSGSIAVLDPVATYPGGIRVGFAIEDVNNLLEALLFGSLTISTYNDGLLQEFANGTDLLNISINNPWIDPGTGIYNVGIETTLPFDEVRITAGGLALVNNEINVYGLFLDLEDFNDPEICGLLPVQWLTFDVKKTERSSTLTWTTAREFNNAGYEVQRSSDGRLFTTIGRVRPNTNPVREVFTYQYIDILPLDGINYYRIRQTDIDGSEQYSPVKTLWFGNTVATTFWPNPVNEGLNIEFASPMGAGKVTIINSTGMIIQEVIFGENDERVWVDFSEVNPGYYQVILESAQGREVKKIAVLR